MTTLRTWWLEVPAAVRFIVTLVGGAGALGALLAAVFDVPARLEAVETDNVRQDSALIRMQTEILGLQTWASHTEYLSCVDASERNFINRTPQDCYWEFLFRERR